MPRPAPALAKLTRPDPSGTVHRSRLFRLLDRAGPKIWMTGPPGAGKTSLISSYVQARRLLALWYQVDERDGDAASFFYYLRSAAQRAAPRRRWRLPLLTSEYRYGLAAFTRQWFEELFAGLRSPFVLVLDNYQDVSQDSVLHGIVRDAFAVLPPAARAIVLSRGDPPRCFARARASGGLTVVDWNVLRLTQKETAAIVKAKCGRGMTAPEIRALHTATGGWAAGVVLMAERPAGASGNDTTTSQRSTQAVFDYFASEILARADPETQRVLLETALLPKITAAQAIAITECASAGETLKDLADRRYFTDLHADPESTFQYHPLFRTFLRTRALAQLSEKRRRDIGRMAAQCFEKAGQIEDAITLLREGEDWDSFAALIHSRASGLLAQGRGQTVAEWLGGVPALVLDRFPWLSIWLGWSLLGSDPRASHEHFARAFARFREAGEPVGALTAWSGAVDGILLEFGDARRLDPWLGHLSTEIEPNVGAAPPEIGFRVASSVCSALLFRAPFGDEMARWVRRAEKLADTSDDQLRRVLTGYYLSVHAVWTGDLARAISMRTTLANLAASRGASPLSRLAALYVQAHTSWLLGEASDCVSSVREALELGESTGVRILDRQLAAIGIYGALNDGRIDEAGDLLERMGQGIQPTQLLDASHHRYVAAWLARISGDAAKAGRLAEEALALTREAGAPFPSAMCLHAVALLSHERGNNEEAKQYLAEALEIATRMNSRMLECACRLAEAEIGLDLGGERALIALADGLAIARGAGYAGFPWWRPDAAARLCARALEAGIEVEYVRRLVRVRRLVPDPAQPVPEAWPCPVRVRALGVFEVEVDARPIRFTGRGQWKPLAMLKALVALGGRGVTERQIVEALWPEADGDAGHDAFAVTLHRLRRLLGHDDAVRRHGGRLELDPRIVWVDVRALDAYLERAAHTAGEARARAIDAAVRLYRGPLLAGDEDQHWTIAVRERLRARVLRRLEQIATSLEAAGQWQQAIDTYLKALEIDDCAEETCRRLMRMYQRLGRRAEAMRVYQRCRASLASTLRVPPSAETEALAREIRSGGSISRPGVSGM